MTILTDPLRARLAALVAAWRATDAGQGAVALATYQCADALEAALRAGPEREPIKTVHVPSQSGEWKLAAHFYDYDYFNRVEAALRAVPVRETCNAWGSPLYLRDGKPHCSNHCQWGHRAA